MKRHAVCALLVLAACRVELKSPIGGACDDEHPCPPDTVCSAGRCRAAASSGDCPSDAGAALVWSQCIDGFSSRHPGAGTLDVGAANALSVSVAAPTTDGPSAEAAAAASLVAFRLRGRLELKAPFSPGARVSLVQVRGVGTVLIELLLDDAQRFTVEHQPGLLAQTEAPQTSTGPVAQAGRTYELELRWARGSAARLFVDGTLAQLVSGAGASPVDATADALRLGISSVAAGGGAVSLTWSGVELLDGAGP